jgi:integral membrane protein
VAYGSSSTFSSHIFKAAGEEFMKGVVLRFRVMALLAGVMSLLLWFVELPVVYLLDNPELAEKVKWIPFVHGYIYAFYVLTAIHFTAKARFTVRQMILFILAGTLPILSFIAERRVARNYKEL